MKRRPDVDKRVRRDTAYFRITWSPLLPVSRWEINGAVPSLPGVWELYYLEHSRIPRFVKMGRAWYGGLRNEIRAESDPDLPQNAAIREVLETGDCYYRYTICEHADDLNDLYSVLVTHRRPRHAADGDRAAGSELAAGRPAAAPRTAQGARREGQTPRTHRAGEPLARRRVATGCPSGRYREVRIQEPDEMEIRRKRTPREERTPPPMTGNRVPNLFDVWRELERLQGENAGSNDAAAAESASPPADDPSSP